MAGKQGPAPTGCYKCGRPGHWSRDCPSSSSAPVDATLPGKPSTNSSTPGAWKPSTSGTWKAGKPSKPTSTTAPVLPRKRPKLTPDLLLSNDGLGYVLENFPRMVKIQGRGHEVEDLGSLLEAYVHWHSRILPYFSFDQFVEKAEKLGSTRRVRMCVHELRDKVLRGDEPKTVNDVKGQDHVEDEFDFQMSGNSLMDGPDGETGEVHHEDAFPADVHEDLFDEFYSQATEEFPAHPDSTSQAVDLVESDAAKATQPDSGNPCVKDISEDQKARMEANRLKALERAKARAAVQSG